MTRSSIAATVLASALLFLGPWSSQARAVVIYDPDGAFRLTGPTPNDNYFFDIQGNYGVGMATPIAPNYLLSVKHLNVPSNNVVTFLSSSPNAGQYSVVQVIDHADSDLRLIKIDQPLAMWADPYFGNGEVGKDVILTGRGTQVGDPVFLSGELRGWEWGTFDGVRSWGENTITAKTTVNVAGTNTPALRWTFDPIAGANQGQLTERDSGGGVFFEEDGRWYLAGINAAVEAPFKKSSGGEDIWAALFNVRNFFPASGPRINQTRGSYGYATQISAVEDWLRSIIVDGDLTGSGSVGIPDFDYFSQVYQSGQYDWRADLNNDGVVDLEDWHILVHDIAGTFFGDVNFDGQVDDFDIQQILASGKFMAGDTGATWADGDMNLDGRVDMDDILLILDSWGSTASLDSLMTMAAIPEPATAGPMMLGAGMLLARRRNR
ncbi:MAG: PEP-CTERM sorting domain-containing protein [Phycisphaeraceae bacterium]|nr:PEP-CTERM sorting domain-containing protein [Phycisphaeraceae bacterium]